MLTLVLGLRTKHKRFVWKDYYGGFTGAIPALADCLSYDIGLLYYDYPGASSHESDGTDGTGGSGTRGMEFLEWYGSAVYLSTTV